MTLDTDLLWFAVLALVSIIICLGGITYALTGVRNPWIALLVLIITAVSSLGLLMWTGVQFVL